MGIALGLYFTWRRIAAAERTVQVAEEGQITERFTRAIDQLGNDRLEIRLGGIYALERIARDSDKDHWPIMEVLTAYVREHASWQATSPSPQATSPEAVDQTPEGNSQQPEPTPSPDTDIQAILTVLGRRTRWYEESELQRLDLRGTDLRRASLVGAHLEGADLWGAHFEGTDLRRALGLTQEQLAQAHTDEQAQLPDYLTTPP